jgi:mannonate dehydratase
MMVNSAQWRFGPILNNAMSGVDEALWDIKGRQVGLPVYELWGGKCREAVTPYAGPLRNDTPEQAVEDAHRFAAMGYKNFKTFFGMGNAPKPKGLWDAQAITDPGVALRHGLNVLETLRKELGPDVGLLYDMHREATPRQAIQFAKDVEPIKLFYLEDPFSNQDFAWHRELRKQCTTPVSAGELFTNPNEWAPLVSERLIDYIRSHVSALGGVTPARKQAAMGELLGVRTSWHGSGDITPIGHTRQGRPEWRLGPAPLAGRVDLSPVKRRARR